MDQQLTEEQLDVYREIFAIYDKNSDGIISFDEFDTVVSLLKQDATDEPLQTIVTELDENQNTSLDFDRFLELVPKAYVLDLVEQMGVMMTFRKFDDDKDGYISKEELRLAMSKDGEPLSDEDLEEVLGGIDIDGDGKINYEEFAQMMGGS